MKYDPDVCHRRSMRLSSWTYSESGAYFVTICTCREECIFVHDDVKRIVVEQWDSIPGHFQNIQPDEFIVMPNHIHGIILIEPVGAGLAPPHNHKTKFVGAGLALPNNSKTNAKKGGASPAPTLGDIICAFKSKTAVQINRFRNTPGKAVWQRNYYERIIRDEDELNRTRRYIMENPFKWDEDPENPQSVISNNKESRR